MIRVLHVINNLDRGGIETNLMALLKRIPREQVAMDIFCKGRQIGVLGETAREFGATIYHHPLTLSHFGFIAGLRRAVTVGKYDIVHNQLNPLSGLTVWALRGYGVKIITKYDTTDLLPEKKWAHRPVIRSLLRAYIGALNRYAIKRSDWVMGVSTATLDFLVPQHRRFANCSVIYNGVTLNSPPVESERAALRTELGLPVDCPLVLHVGRFSQGKNHRAIIRVFDAVSAAIPQARLLLVGAGELLPDIQEQVRARNLAERVLFLGVRADVPRLMRSADAFLFPSLFEGFGVVVVEAMSSYLPTIASDIPPIAGEIIQSGTSGLLHDVDDEDGMARSVVRVLTDSEFAKQLASAGRAQVEEHFNLDVTAEKYIKLYEQVAGKSST